MFCNNPLGKSNILYVEELLYKQPKIGLYKTHKILAAALLYDPKNPSDFVSQAIELIDNVVCKYSCIFFYFIMK